MLIWSINLKEFVVQFEKLVINKSCFLSLLKSSLLVCVVYCLGHFAFVNAETSVQKCNEPGCVQIINNSGVAFAESVQVLINNGVIHVKYNGENLSENTANILSELSSQLNLYVTRRQKVESRNFSEDEKLLLARQYLMKQQEIFESLSLEIGGLNLDGESVVLFQEAQEKLDVDAIKELLIKNQKVQDDIVEETELTLKKHKDASRNIDKTLMKLKQIDKLTENEN